MEKEFEKVNSGSSFQKIYKVLLEVACSKAAPYCYRCFREAPTGVCGMCKSDDLLRSKDGDPYVNYARIAEESAIDELLSSLTEISRDDLDAEFDDFLNDFLFDNVIIFGHEDGLAEIFSEEDPAYYNKLLNDYYLSSILSEKRPDDLNKPLIEINDVIYRTTEVVKLINEERDEHLAVNG